MSDPVLFPDNRIEYSPTASGSPSDFRGVNADGWKVRKQDKPNAIFDLTKPDGKTPSLLEKVELEGNVKTVFVRFQTVLDGDFENYKDEPVDVSEGELKFGDDVQRGIEVYKLWIDFLTPISDDEESSFDVRLNVFACIEGR